MPLANPEHAHPLAGSAWDREAIARANEGKGIQQITAVDLFPGCPPLKVFCGDMNALVTYHAMQGNAVLLAAMAADPPLPREAGEDGAAEAEPAPEQDFRAQLQRYDQAFALGIIEPRYYRLDELPADGRLPMDGLCIHSFDWVQRARLLAAILGDTSLLEMFRGGPASTDPPAPDGEGIREGAERVSDAGAAAAPSVSVRRGRAVSRRAGGNTLAAGGDAAAESAA